MNWFQRHLDITLFLFFLSWVLFIIFISEIFNDINLYRDMEVRDIVGIFGLVSICAVTGWYLEQKNRSLAWLLLLPVPLGIIGILWLGNKNKNNSNL